MKSRSMLFLATLASGLALGSGRAGAAVVEATFTGIAYGSFTHGMSPPAGNIDGETITGTFSFDPALATPNDSCPPGFLVCYLPGTPTLEFQVDGMTATFQDEGMVGIQTTAYGTEIYFLPEWLPDDPYHYASLSLTGSFIDGMDLTSFRAGPVDLDHSGASFFDSRDFGSNVQLTSFTFAAAAVPEAPAWTMLVAAIVLLCVLFTGAARRPGLRRSTRSRRMTAAREDSASRRCTRPLRDNAPPLLA